MLTLTIEGGVEWATAASRARGEEQRRGACEHADGSGAAEWHVQGHACGKSVLAVSNVKCGKNEPSEL